VLTAPGLAPLQALPAFFSVWVLPASGLVPPQALLPLEHPETAKLEPAIRLAMLKPANIFLSWSISMLIHPLSE